MGENWRKIFTNPDKKGILPGYRMYKKYKIEKGESYENEEVFAILFVKDE
jgi:hypothetical protein